LQKTRLSVFLDQALTSKCMNLEFPDKKIISDYAPQTIPVRFGVNFTHTSFNQKTPVLIDGRICDSHKQTRALTLVLYRR